MTPTNNDRTQQTLIGLIAGNICLFLMEQRARHNDKWFSVEEIAAELDLRRHLIPSYLALKQLGANPRIERLDGRIRCSA